MTINVVLITNARRKRLLEQSIDTLIRNTPLGSYTLAIVMDGALHNGGNSSMKVSILTVHPACRVLSRLKNLGVYWSEQQFGRGDYLCIVDDDVAFRTGWVDAMVKGLPSSVKLVGGDRHQYHIPNTNFGNVEVTDAVAGYCHFMTWETWDKYGPYEGTAEGIGQSEDFAFSRKIVDDGYYVGYVTPPVVVHCGITNSIGKPAIGSEYIKRIEGLIYE